MKLPYTNIVPQIKTFVYSKYCTLEIQSEIKNNGPKVIPYSPLLDIIHMICTLLNLSA